MKRLKLALVLFTAAYCSSPQSEQSQDYLDDGTSVEFVPGLRPFYHGVASGDPLSDRVVIWTRVTPPSEQEVEVTWEMSPSPNFKDLTASGTATTDRSRDYTMKVDATGLASGTDYYYRFKALDAMSPTGRTRTMPQEQVDKLVVAVVSCSNYEAGYFNAYGRIAQKDVDLVLHLGDYIYEYAPQHYGDSTLDRSHLPANELLTLRDYRTRYAQYRLDPHLREVHKKHPFITVWDDHEIANNTYAAGAENHQPGEGDFETRKNAAVQAYLEWLPVREKSGNQIYRSFSLGPMADIVMLDERLEARSQQLKEGDPNVDDPDRTMLGEVQLAWLTKQLSGSQAIWKIVGNQVIFSPVDQKLAYPGWGERNYDAWDGYPAERVRVVHGISQNSVDNVIFLTGDTHSSWAIEVAIDPGNTQSYDPETSEGAVAIEFGTPSISSANLNESVSTESARQVENILTDPAINPHLKFTNQRDHGYVLLTLTRENARADWYYVDRLNQPSDQEFLGKSYVVKRGTHRLMAVD